MRPADSAGEYWHESGFGYRAGASGVDPGTTVNPMPMRPLRLDAILLEHRYHLEEASVRFGASHAALVDAVRRGELPTTPDGRRTVVRGADLVAWCEARERERATRRAGGGHR
jgi:hypothetical protein